MDLRTPNTRVVDFATVAGLVKAGLAPDHEFPTLLRRSSDDRTHIDAGCPARKFDTSPDTVVPVHTWDDYLNGALSTGDLDEQYALQRMCATCCRFRVDLNTVLAAGAEAAEAAVLFWANLVGTLTLGTLHPYGWVAGNIGLGWNVPAADAAVRNPVASDQAVQRLRNEAMALYFDVLEKRRAVAAAHFATHGAGGHARFADTDVRHVLTRLGADVPDPADWLYVQLPSSTRPVDMRDYPALPCGIRYLFSCSAFLRHLQNQVRLNYDPPLTDLRWVKVTEPVTTASLARLNRALELAGNLGRVGDVTDVDHMLGDLVAS